MASESLEFSIKVLIGKQLLLGFDPKLDLWREADIQIDKLDRMVKKFDEKFPPSLILQVPVHELRRKKGPALHGVAQQSKRVDKIISKLMEQHTLRHLLPSADYALRRKLKKAVEMYVVGLNRMAYKARKQMQLDAAKIRHLGKRSS
jgi:hypothetical protein